MALVVSLEEKRRSGPSIEALLRLCADDLAEVDRILAVKMQSPVGLIPQVASHLVDAGGKRLRPLLTVAAAQLCGYASPRNDHVRLATCVELIHSATLLHDDVVDRSGMRRGKPAANIVWGDKTSVLVGDFLFTRAFELMVEVGSLDTLAVLSRASSVIAEGEVLQLVSAQHTSTGEATYLEVIRGKTAKLFAAAAEVGAITAAEHRARQRSESGERDARAIPERTALESYGMNIGIAFQLVDDTLDYGGRQAKLGKELGDDFREGKITLPVILAFHRGDETERAFWTRVMETPEEQRPEDFAHALDLVTRHNALADTLDRARHYGAVARDALGLFPDSALKRAMLEAVDFAVERSN